MYYLEISVFCHKLHNMQYTVFVGDSDSAAYMEVVSAQPYGQNVEIKKEYNDTKLEDGKGLGGRGRWFDHRNWKRALKIG